MTVRKHNIVFHKCCSGCGYIVTNKSSFKKHLDSVSHMITNRIKNKNACKLCIEGDEYTGQHLNYHEMASEKNSIDCYIDILMNERLKDFTLDCNQSLQAQEWNGEDFTD
jgi:hypothetical protein